MTRLLLNLVKRKSALGLAALAGLAAVAAAPKTASADWRVGIDLRNGWHSSSYETRTTRVWVEPVYRTVCDRQWVEPTYQTVCERIWVPDRYEERQIVRYDGWCRRVECVRVLAEPAHYEFRERQVVVAAGYWQDVRRQELVSPGHWEYRQERFASCDPCPPQSRVRIEFGGR